MSDPKYNFDINLLIRGTLSDRRLHVLLLRQQHLQECLRTFNLAELVIDFDNTEKGSDEFIDAWTKLKIASLIILGPVES
jgi:hypothetical protein